MNDLPLIFTWFGKTPEEMSREELIAAFKSAARDLVEVREDRKRWRDAADPLAYLLSGSRT